MTSMMVRKGFCCRHLIDAFVHRMMASGIYSKIVNDANFFECLGIFFAISRNGYQSQKIEADRCCPGIHISFIWLFVIFFGSYWRNFVASKESKTFQVINNNNKKNSRCEFNVTACAQCCCSDIFLKTRKDDWVCNCILFYLEIIYMSACKWLVTIKQTVHNF